MFGGGLDLSHCKLASVIRGSEKTSGKIVVDNINIITTTHLRKMDFGSKKCMYFIFFLFGDEESKSVVVIR